jgi:rod shape determining protein RodA
MEKGDIATTLGLFASRIDWLLFIPALLLAGAGLLTMNSFVGENLFFEKQLIWLVVAIGLFIALSFVDFRFLRRSGVITGLFLGAVAILLLVFVFGDVIKGAQSRFDIGLFSIQPADPAKLVLILILAKYFSRRHIEIAHIRHVLISGMYAFILFALVLLQPDFGSAIILFCIWFGMVLVSGISRKHLLGVFAIGIIAFSILWVFVFAEYQKDRIHTFLNPLTDLQGAGYNAYQSTVAVGSGQVVGKGVGYGTQSKLSFLPEYETDFIFAAFAEEWGFVGTSILLALFGVVIWRILTHAMRGATNFEILFGVGIALLFISHFVIHIGMNVGLLPVTGTTIPFMSYGGSHLVTEFVALGMLMGMRQYGRSIHKDDTEREFLGV